MIHKISCTDRGRQVSARFSEEPAPQVVSSDRLSLPIYRQHDGHSCGFLAVLTVVRYFAPALDMMEVLRIVRPSMEYGCDQRRVLRSLDRLGVSAVYADTLNMVALWSFTRSGSPVIVTVCPGGGDCDHWTVVRGVDPERGLIYLTNYREEGMPWRDFEKVWFEQGDGLICRPN